MASSYRIEYRADVLQICMPVFEGLFDPDDENIIMNVLYLLSSVHALAKLRLHTDATLTSLLQLSIRFGNALRLFHTEVCHKYETKELHEEAQKRMRRELSERMGEESSTSKKTRRGVTEKKFSMLRPKLHFLGDYVRCILQFGTTDSYSTAIVSAIFAKKDNI